MRSRRVGSQRRPWPTSLATPSERSISPALAPVKKLLKRFFSDEPWTDADDRSLADLVGPGDGWWRHELDDGLVLEFGWRDGLFRLEPSARDALGETFDGPVVPEATPNPRTIRFVTTSIHEGPSRWYESASDRGRSSRVAAVRGVRRRRQRARGPRLRRGRATPSRRLGASPRSRAARRHGRVRDRDPRARPPMRWRSRRGTSLRPLVHRRRRLPRTPSIARGESSEVFGRTTRPISIGSLPRGLRPMPPTARSPRVC